MKAASLGLLLSLLSGGAMAQMPPASTPASPPSPSPTAAAAPAGPPDGGTNTPVQQPGSNANPEPNDQVQGEVIQTPNGTYMVAEPPDKGEQPPAQGEGADMQSPQMQDGMGPHGRPLAMSKAARLRIKSPDLTLAVKCPDDEPMKACVDATAELLDKVMAAHR